jgi:hypothetical protein
MYRWEAYTKENQEAITLPENPDAMDPPLPEHIKAAFFPKTAAEQGRMELGAKLIDKRIRYREDRSGEILECTVRDYGTSHLRGNFFTVVYGDETEDEVTERMMTKILGSAEQVRSLGKIYAQRYFHSRCTSQLGAQS